MHPCPEHDLSSQMGYTTFFSYSYVKNSEFFEYDRHLNHKIPFQLDFLCFLK